MSVEEGTHTLADGKQLYTKTFRTDGPAKARLVFIHGFSDHVNTYGSFFPHLASRGIEVYTFDQRYVCALLPIFDTEEAQGMGSLCNKARRARRHGPD
jgi:predicted alpha/beta hydrolase